MQAFNTTTGIPASRVNLKWGKGRTGGEDISTAEAGTISLEFTLLSYLTGDYIYRDAALKALSALSKAATDLPALTISRETGNWTSPYSSIGPGVDSYYEYLVKSYVALGCSGCLAHFYRVDKAVQRYMDQDGWILDVEIQSKRIASGVISSLAAFWPGVEVILGKTEDAIRHFSRFYSIWSRFSAIPDVFSLQSSDLMHFGREYPLRPELIESLHYLYHSTHHPLFLSIASLITSDLLQARVKCGFATIADVHIADRYHDLMETYFLSETLKYLDLTFREAETEYYQAAKAMESLLEVCVLRGEKELSMGKWVLTTEGHLVPVLSGLHLFDMEIVPVFRSQELTCTAYSAVEIAGWVTDYSLQDIYSEHKEKRRNATLLTRPSLFVHNQPIDPSLSLLRVRLPRSQVLLTLSKAAFGTSFPGAAVLVPSTPIHACGVLANEVRGKVRTSQVVLVERGECDFVEKALSVQAAGAIGLIVVDDRLANSALITMVSPANSPRVHISCAFASFEDGLRFR